MFRRSALALAVLLCAAGAARAQGSYVVTLEDLGYTAGVALTSPRSSTQVFFPLPSDRGATLNLDLSFSRALDAFSSLTVTIDGNPVHSVTLGDGARQQLSLPIPPRYLEGEFLRVGFAADLALARTRCFDNSGPSVWALIDPSSRIEVRRDDVLATTVGNVWRSATGNVTVGIPANAGPDALATALHLMTALYRRSAKPRLVVTDDAAPVSDLPLIIVEPSAALRTAQRIPPDDTLGLVLQPDGATRPRLFVANGAAARILTDVAEATRSQTRVIASRGGAPGPVAPAVDVSFTELGLPPFNLTFGGTASVRIPISTRSLPSGRVPREIVLFGQGAALADEEVLVANFFLGNVFVNSLAMRGTPRFNGHRIAVPEALLRDELPLEIRFQHIARRPACERDGLMEFQLRPSSFVRTETDAWSPRRFDQWSVRRGETVTVQIPQGNILPVMPLIARLLAQSATPTATIAVQRDGRVPTGPFIHVGTSPPTELASAPIALTRGMISVNLPATFGELSFEPGTAYTIVQLAQAAGQYGLWISPGALATLNDPDVVGEGNVALYDGRGQPISFDTSRSDIRVEYAVADDIVSLLNRYRVPIVVGVWVLLTLGVIALLVGLRRRKA